MSTPPPTATTPSRAPHIMVMVAVAAIALVVFAATRKVETSGAMLYKQECSDCHIAYPARFLPSTSWQQTLGQLDQHFGKKVSLDSDTSTSILQYLNDNAADKRSDKSRNRIEQQIQKLGYMPARITELPWFVRRHQKPMQRMKAKNASIDSMSQCEKCHRGAERGKF